MLTHETRFESLRKVKRNLRTKEILLVLFKYGRCTSREIAYKLGYKDLNSVRPRITEAVQDGVICAVGKKFDPVTNRRVAVFELAEEYRDTADW